MFALGITCTINESSYYYRANQINAVSHGSFTAAAVRTFSSNNFFFKF